MKKMLAVLALTLLTGGSGAVISPTPAEAIGINFDGRQGRSARPQQRTQTPQRPQQRTQTQQRRPAQRR